MSCFIFTLRYNQSYRMCLGAKKRRYVPLPSHLRAIMSVVFQKGRSRTLRLANSYSPTHEPVVSPEIRFGLSALCVLPNPSCPLVLLPQQRTLPLTRTAHECHNPAATATAIAPGRGGDQFVTDCPKQPFGKAQRSPTQGPTSHYSESTIRS